MVKVLPTYLATVYTPTDIQTVDQIKTSITKIKGMGTKNFGGMAIWDAGYSLSFHCDLTDSTAKRRRKLVNEPVSPQLP